MNKTEKKQMMHDNYHGVVEKPHILAHAWMFTQGMTTANRKFASIMERSIVDGRTRLKQEATQETDYAFTVSEIPFEGDNSRTITLLLLRRKGINSTFFFSLQSVEKYAETAVKYCKSATAFGCKLLQADGSLPSGWNRQDFFDKVLDHMYIEIKNEPDAKKTKSGEEREALLSTERPPKWVFPGFMAFVAFGPLAESEDLKSNLMTGRMYCCVLLSCFMLILKFFDISYFSQQRMKMTTKTKAKNRHERKKSN